MADDRWKFRPHTEELLHTSRHEGKRPHTSELKKEESIYQDEYRRALDDGEMDVAYSRVMFLGSGGVGKTCLKRSLMKEPWDPPSMNSTIVSDIHHVRPVGYQWQSLGHDADDQWRVVTKEDEIQEMAELLAAVHDHSGIRELKSKMRADQLYQVDDKSSSSADLSQQTVEMTFYVNSVLSKAIDCAESMTSEQLLHKTKPLKSSLEKSKRGAIFPNHFTPQPLVHMWDCGGQPVFLEVLPAFLTSRTMFLLIYDASRSLHDRLKSVQTIRGERIENEDLNMTTLYLMHSWLSNIYTHLAKRDSDGCILDYPRVLCIGTHGDKVEDHEAKINELKSYFKGKPFEALIDGFYIVDNTTSGKGKVEDANFAKVRQKICKFTSEKLIVKTPISWVLFRKVIGIYKANVISLDKEAQAIGVACKIPPEVVPKVLLFYHDLGVVLFYPHIRGLHDRVIINPKWFVKALGKVLTLETNFQIQSMWELLHDKGILVQPLCVAVWREVKDISPEAMIELLVHFHLAAKVTTDEYHNPDVKQYFLPLVLPSYGNKEQALSGYLQRATPLHLTFRTKFVPPGFFTRLVTILAESSKCKIRFEKGVYRDRIHIFYGDHLHDDVILMEQPHAIQVEVFRCCPESPVLPQFPDVCQMLTKDLIEISKEVDHCLFASHGSQKSKCKLFKNVQFICSKCPPGDPHYIRHKNTRHISCDKTVKSDKYRSLTVEESHWFPKVDDVFPPTLPPVAVQQQIPPVILHDNHNGREANLLTGINSSDEDLLDKEPKLNNLATQLHPVKSQWRAIGVQLDIPNYELDSIGRDPTLDDSDKLTKVCQLWKDKRTTEVSWRKIAKVIRKPPIQNVDVYRQLETCLGIQQSAHMTPMGTNQPIGTDLSLSTSQTTITSVAQPITDKDQLKRLKQILKDVLKENEENLRPVIDRFIVSIAHHMHQDGLITPAVSNAPTYEGIIDSFQLSLGLKKSQQQIEEHCSKFINVLRSVGGPAKDAAATLHDEWTKGVNEKISIVLKIDYCNNTTFPGLPMITDDEAGTPAVPTGVTPAVPPAVPTGVTPAVPPAVPTGVTPGVTPTVPPAVPQAVPTGVTPGVTPAVTPAVIPPKPQSDLSTVLVVVLVIVVAVMIRYILTV